MMIHLNRPSSALEFEVEAISDYPSFLDLEKVWNDLVEQSGIDHPFLRHEWVRTWWECFGVGKQLHILVVRADKEPIAIAPFMWTVERMYGFKVRRLQSISNEHTPRFDFIITRWPEEAYRAIWNYLVNQRSLWDVVEVQQLPSGSRTLVELPRLATQDAFLTGLWRSSESPYLPLRGSWEKYFKSLDSKYRCNLRNRLKRLSCFGDVRMEVVYSDEQLEMALEEGMRLEASSWKGSAGTAIRSHPDVRLFYTKLATRAVNQGWLRLQFLTVGQRRIAFSYSLSYKNKLFFIKPGYDPQYAPYSPGNLLCYFALQDTFERGLSEYDFLGTNDPYKLKWTKETRPHTWVFVLPNTWHMRLLYLIKFGLVPRFQRSRLYRWLRDAVL